MMSGTCGPVAGGAFEVLPDELILLILSNLARPVDLVVASCVCHRLRVLASDPPLWRRHLRRLLLETVRLVLAAASWRGCDPIFRAMFGRIRVGGTGAGVVLVGMDDGSSV